MTKKKKGLFRNTRFFGTGTVTALIASTAIVAYGQMAKPDAVRLRSKLASPVHALRKPEPGQLLGASGIGLSQDQRSRIEKIASAWQVRKASLEASMAGFRPQQARMDELRTSLEDYSRISRQYDAERSEAWQNALAVLTPSQRSQVSQ